MVRRPRSPTVVVLLLACIGVGAAVLWATDDADGAPAQSCSYDGTVCGDEGEEPD